MCKALNKSSDVFINRVIEEIILLEKLNIHKFKIDGYIDVGANIGQNTMSSRIFFPSNIPIYSFEPQISSFKKLKSICDGLSSVYLYNYGVGDKNETKNFFRSLSSETSQASSFLEYSQLYKTNFPWGNAPIVEEFVNVVKLDTFFMKEGIKLGNNLFLHIDTEGFEYFVLKGANEYILPKVKCIILEITFDLFINQENFEKIFDLLRSDFEFKGFLDPLVIGDSGESLYQDAFFVRKSIKNMN